LAWIEEIGEQNGWPVSAGGGRPASRRGAGLIVSKRSRLDRAEAAAGRISAASTPRKSFWFVVKMILRLAM